MPASYLLINMNYISKRRYLGECCVSSPWVSSVWSCVGMSPRQQSDLSCPLCAGGDGDQWFWVQAQQRHPEAARVRARRHTHPRPGPEHQPECAADPEGCPQHQPGRRESQKGPLSVYSVGWFLCAKVSNVDLLVGVEFTPPLDFIVVGLCMHTVCLKWLFAQSTRLKNPAYACVLECRTWTASWRINTPWWRGWSLKREMASLRPRRGLSFCSRKPKTSSYRLATSSSFWKVR